MATLTVQEAGFVGLDNIVFDAADAAGDDFVNDGRTILIVKNTDAAPKTVTVNSQALCSQGFDHDIAVIVPDTTGESIIGTFPKGRFNDATGKVAVSYSSVTGVSVAAVRI